MVNRWRNPFVHVGFSGSDSSWLDPWSADRYARSGDNEGDLVRLVTRRDSVRNLTIQGQDQQTWGSG